MESNFSEHVAREKVVRKRINQGENGSTEKEDRVEELKAQLLEERRRNKRLRERQRFHQEQQHFHRFERSILAKYPAILQLQSYNDYLKAIVERMDGQHVRNGRIVFDATGKESVGHMAEYAVFGRPAIGPRSRIITLRSCEPESKRLVFDDLVCYYGHDFFHKRTVRAKSAVEEESGEQCLLGTFARSALEMLLSRQGYANVDIKIVSAVGTPLDFHFGVDGWVEIAHKDHDEPIRIFIDLKTRQDDSYRTRGTSFADMKMFAHIDDEGGVDLTTQKNAKALVGAVMDIVKLYAQKRREQGVE